MPSGKRKYFLASKKKKEFSKSLRIFLHPINACNNFYALSQLPLATRELAILHSLKRWSGIFPDELHSG